MASLQRPRPVSPRIDKLKADLLELTDQERAHVRAWIRRWVDGRGAIVTLPGLPEDDPRRKFFYPPRIDWSKHRR